jgi:hypothetical protein
MHSPLALVLAAGALASTLATAARAQAPARSVTIYSSAQPGAIDPDQYRPVAGRHNYAYGQGIPGYAVVREDRQVSLNVGRTEVRITDVAALIDPTTVSFRSLTDADTRVVDQNFQFDLISNDKLLQRYIDKPIEVDILRGQQAAIAKGTLLSAQPGSLVLRNGDVIEVLNGYQGLTLPELPDGLITRPTLLWNIFTQRQGDHTARISYQTQGITWWADYNLIFAEGANANSGTLDLSAWVSILNQSGATYRDSQLKLVAGEVQRAPKAMGYRGLEMRRDMAMPAAAEAPSFEEKSFFEYHLYTLSEPTTIPENSTKQLELFPTARDIPVEKILLYAGQGGFEGYGGLMTDQDYGVPSERDVSVYLRFKNDAKSSLGVPLPGGRIRVSKMDPADGGMEFIGEDVIRHTPKDETVLIRLGKSFDVVGERKQTDFRVDNGRRTMQETIEVEIRNRKQEQVDVVVQERMFRWTNWEFVGQAPQHTKLDARTVHFPVTLAPGEVKSVRFTVKYSW